MHKGAQNRKILQTILLMLVCLLAYEPKKSWQQQYTIKNEG